MRMTLSLIRTLFIKILFSTEKNSSYLIIRSKTFFFDRLRDFLHFLMLDSSTPLKNINKQNVFFHITQIWNANEIFNRRIFWVWGWRKVLYLKKDIDWLSSSEMDSKICKYIQKLSWDRRYKYNNYRHNEGGDGRWRRNEMKEEKREICRLSGNDSDIRRRNENIFFIINNHNEHKSFTFNWINRCINM